jgi:nucleoside-diphosphate-sugar epimerase
VRVVVTGAAGFIGSHLTADLVAAGHDVVAVDLPARIRAAGALPEGVVPLGLDLAGDDLAPLTAAVTARRAHAVLHLAGRPGVRTSFGPGRAASVRHNVTATRRLLAACRAAVGDRPGHQPAVVLASSSSVYGGARADRPQREDDALRPVSPYARSKVRAERLVLAAGDAGLPVLVLRYFSVYGSRQRPDMAFHRFVEAALDGRPLPVLGGLEQRRSFTHVADTVAGTVAATAALVTGGVPSGTVLNLGHPVPASLGESVELLGAMLDRRPAVALRPPAAGDVPRTWADGGRAERLLGWTPTVGLAEGLAEQLAWHRALRAGTPQAAGAAGAAGGPHG